MLIKSAIIDEFSTPISLPTIPIFVRVSSCFIRLEHLIHAFLAKQRLNMTLISSKGVAYKPTEWFMVDRDTAIAVVEHIVAGDIMNYRMDNTTGRIKKIR